MASGVTVPISSARVRLSHLHVDLAEAPKGVLAAASPLLVQSHRGARRTARATVACSTARQLLVPIACHVNPDLPAPSCESQRPRRLGSHRGQQKCPPEASAARSRAAPFAFRSEWSRIRAMRSPTRGRTVAGSSRPHPAAAGRSSTPI